MKYKRHKKIKCYKIIKLHEYAIVFSDSEKLIEFVCHIKSQNITKSSLYTKDDYYQLLLSVNTPLTIDTHITFRDNFHIDEIRRNSHLICKYDAVNKMQKAFIKP